MSFFEKMMNFFGFEKIKGVLTSRWKIKTRPETSVTQVISNSPIQYVMNDPSTPDLIKNISPPVYTGKYPFTVKNYKGGGFGRASIEGQSANCFVTITDTLNYFISKSAKPLPRWAGTSNLQVFPRAGVDLNAYYDRSSLRFFFYTDSRIGGTIYTCDSSDIVAHELGHCILDTFRPQTWNAALFEVDAFHEAFGDFSALIHAMKYDEVINKALAETNNDLKKPNVITRLAEQFGIAIYRLEGPNSGRNSDCLRSAINSFNYVNPSTLPSDAPANQLSNEPHSFSQIFLGAFYDLFILFYEDNVQNGKMSPLNAVKSARDLLATYTLKAIQNVPINAHFFQSMATTLLWADVVLSSRKYHDRMHQIFVKRNLSPATLKMLTEGPTCPENDLVLKISSIMSIKLQDKVIRTQNNNPLYGAIVEIPSEQIYLYDEDKNLYDSILVTEDESIQGACEMIDYLHTKNKVSDQPTTPFEIRDGKLVRTHIS